MGAFAKQNLQTPLTTQRVNGGGMIRAGPPPSCPQRLFEPLGGRAMARPACVMGRKTQTWVRPMRESGWGWH